MAGEPHALVAERSGERMDVLGHGLLVVALRRLGGLPKAAQVGRNHSVCPRQFCDQRPPHMAVLRVAVQQDDRFAFAGGQVVQSRSVDAREAALDRWFLWRLLPGTGYGHHRSH